MLRDPNKIGIGARWEPEVFGVLPDGEVVASGGENDYQGHEWVIARLDDGKWLHYEWSYGSCSGCDAWEDQEHLIAAEVASKTSVMSKKALKKYLEECKKNQAYWSGPVELDELFKKAP